MAVKSILLIEDNPDDRFFIKKYLSMGNLKGWEIAEAVRLSDAIEYIEQTTPEVILLDLSLPDSHGEETFNQAKRNAPHIPIVILTGLSDINVSKKLIQKGAQDYLVKGEYDTRLLEKSIEYAIERHRLKLENDRTKERLIDSVLETQDRERARIAKELHDGVVQSLTVVSLSLGLFRKSAASFDKTTQLHFEKCTEHLSNTIDEIRNISHTLMPRSIAEMSLAEALGALVEDMEYSTGINFHFLINLMNEPDEKLKLAIYRIVQELVNNAVKHSQATTLFIQTIEYTDYIYLMVEDNGVGFSKTDIMGSKNCFGLYSIESRVNSLNGTLEIDSKPGKGTNILITFFKNQGF